MNRRAELTIEVVQLVRGRGHMAFGRLSGNRPNVGDAVELIGRNGASYPGTVRSVEYSATPGLPDPEPQQIGLGINGPAAEHLGTGLILKVSR